MAENLAWLIQETEEPECNKGNFTPPTPRQENKARHIFRKTNISYPLIRTRTRRYG